MTDNILKKHVERTAKELVAEVYPADKPYRDVADEKDVKRGKKYYEAAEHVLNALVAGSTTLVSDMSLSLADNASADEMKNVFSLCVVAYLFVTRHLRASSRFRGIVKAIRDNRTEHSLTTRPLLANLRSLIGEERIRNITGRPRKPPEKEPDQLEFAFRPKARTAQAESLDRFWDCLELFFAQCFRGPR